MLQIGVPWFICPFPVVMDSQSAVLGIHVDYMYAYPGLDSRV